MEQLFDQTNPLKSIRLIVFTALTAATLSAQPLPDVARFIRQGNLDSTKIVLSRIPADSAVESRFFLEGLIQTKADSACQIYEQLLDCYPRGRYTDEALIRLGQYDFILGDYRQSLDRLDQLIRNFPDSPNLQKAQYWMGLCYSALDEPDSAVTHYQTAARDFPNSDVTPLAQAELKSTQNRETSGEDDYIVQVGAFGDKSNAAFVRNRLKREGILTVMQTKTVDGRKLFVVTAGKPATKREAEALAERLNKKFGWDARVVAGP